MVPLLLVGGGSFGLVTQATLGLGDRCEGLKNNTSGALGNSGE